MEYDLVKNLFINIFVLLFLIQLLHLWYVKKGLKESRDPALIGVGLSLSIFISLAIPINLAGSPIGFTAIPIIIGTLYGGVWVGVYLLLVSIGIHLFIMNPELTSLKTISEVIPLLISALFSRRYKRLHIKGRMIAILVIGFFSGVLVFFLLMQRDGVGIDYLDIFLFLLLQTIAVLWIACSIERLKKNREWKRTMIEAEKLQVVSHLAASISHEIRNPLTSTKGFLQLLRNDINLSKEKREQFIDIAISELDRAETIIGDYLTFAKPNTNIKEALDIQEEIRRVLKIAQPLANMNAVDIVFEVPSFMVLGERELFQQCFINLIKNALESMPQGGKLTVKGSIKQKGVMITISDTGIGMTEEQLKRLGEPYYSTKGSKGTGLGIMGAYRIIQSMDGAVKVKSKVGTGTVFTIYFPGHETGLIRKK